MAGEETSYNIIQDTIHLNFDNLANSSSRINLTHIDPVGNHDNDTMFNKNYFWWSEYTSMILENKGAVARDHMANERTFLAWLRTSLAFMSIGVGVTQLFKLEIKDVDDPSSAKNGTSRQQNLGKPLGAMFIVIGILSLVFGCIRYFQVQNMLTSNQFPASRVSIGTLIVVVFTAIVVTFAILLKDTSS